jgi:hypothetical protein
MSDEERVENIFFIAGPLIATALVFGGRYAMARGVEVEILDVADLDIIGAALIAIGFLVFAFSFFFGVNKFTSSQHRLAIRVVFVMLYCAVSAGLLGLAWFTSVE